MVTVKCQYTGIEFETDSRRTKNHPQISQFFNSANDDSRQKQGAYRKAKEIVKNLAGKYDDIDSLMAAAIAEYNAWLAGDAKSVSRRRTAGDAIRERKAKRQHREAQNAILRKNGYRWEKVKEGTEDSWAGAGSLGAGIGESTGRHNWQLVAPDGNVVTVAQAMSAINS